MLTYNEACTYHTSKKFYSQKAKMESLGSQFTQNIPSENRTESHVLARNRKATGQLQEMQDSSVYLGRDTNRRVIGTGKWFNVKNG